MPSHIIINKEVEVGGAALQNNCNFTSTTCLE